MAPELLPIPLPLPALQRGKANSPVLQGGISRLIRHLEARGAAGDAQPGVEIGRYDQAAAPEPGTS